MRIDAAEHLVKMHCPVPLSQSNKPLPQLEVRSRTFKQRASQSAQVETRPSDEDCVATAGFDVAYGFAGESGVLARCEVFSRFYEVDQVVGNSAPRFGRDLGGCYVETAVDLDGIEVDDLAVDSEGELDAQLAFSRRGRPDNRGYHALVAVFMCH